MYIFACNYMKKIKRINVEIYLLENLLVTKVNKVQNQTIIVKLCKSIIEFTNEPKSFASINVYFCLQLEENESELNFQNVGMV
jgi:hypothetical protein